MLQAGDRTHGTQSGVLSGRPPVPFARSGFAWLLSRLSAVWMGARVLRKELGFLGERRRRGPPLTEPEPSRFVFPLDKTPRTRIKTVRRDVAQPGSAPASGGLIELA